ncbi:hypothetical protein [Vibrio tapetis]|uniref:Uncharacterized protein n=1 Tax=Vibrio tapetis subsp. tapetis TaxID=1671868 RepID=A0A2N8ZDC3_9VIBR|nr:hypothetical protein [Vibrio tapetis]SON49921.1 conserved protein of unknown function [Vibrio tapetis subsp. tapetis]
MILATFLKNMLWDDEASGDARRFARLKPIKNEETFYSVSIDDDLFSRLIWPMNTFHVLAKIFDTYDVYQKIVSLENETDYLSQFHSGHGRNWGESLIKAETSQEIFISSRFYSLLYSLFSRSRVSMKIEDLLEDSGYLRALFQLYIASDACAYRIQSYLYRNSPPLINEYSEKLVARKGRSIISSLSQCDKTNGVIQFKSHTPQAGISLNSLSHDLAYIKPGVEVAALVGNSTQSRESHQYNVLILPWPLEVKDEFFEQDDKPTLQMDEGFGFFAYVNHHAITCQMVIYAIESCEEQSPDLVVIPECAVNSNDKRNLLEGLRAHFLAKGTTPPVIIFGIFGEGDCRGTYGENSLDLLYENRFVDRYVGENQKKHHRWALDETQLNTYGLGHVLSTDKVKWWENCSTGERKLISYQDDYIHICPLICEDLARQDPIAPVLRSLGPDLVVALLLDGPQIPQRWPGTYAKMLTEEPGCSVLSISPYGMTQRSTGDINPATGLNYEPSSNIALWSEVGGAQQTLELEKGRVGILLTLKFSEQKQWSADGRGENKRRLFYFNHHSVGDTVELSNLELPKVQGKKLTESA